MPDQVPAIDCAIALRQLWDYLDDELTADRMLVIRGHLLKCRHCLQHAEFAEQFLAALAKSRDERTCPHEVRARVMTSLRSAGFVPH